MLRTVTLPYTRFTWHKETRAFVAEQSELREWILGERIRLVGKKSKVLYQQSRTLFSADGEEIQGWELEPTPESQQAVPSCRGTKIVIFND